MGITLGAPGPPSTRARPRRRSTLALVAFAATLACGARASLEAPTWGAGAAGGGLGGAGHGATGGALVGGAAGGGSGGDAGAGPAADPVELCVRAASCAEPSQEWPVFSASSCVDSLARLGWHYASPATLPDPSLAARLTSCASAPDCEGYRACFGGGFIGLSRCREGAHCAGEGELMQSAFDGPTFDCATLDASCADLWSGALRACCNAAPCDGSTPISCDGERASWCGGWGERVVFDCAPSGRTCVAGGGAADGYHPCAGAGAPCDPTAPVACDGDVATYCSAGRLATWDCAATTFRSACDEGGSALMPCRPAGSACDEWHTSVCEGDGLVVCVDGELRTVSCPALGFAGCAATMGGARCVE